MKTNRFTLRQMEEMLEYLPAVINATIHVNHENCPEGVDVKKRLYVTPTEDKTALLFYCHHCQGRGIYRFTKYTSKLPEDTVSIEGTERLKECPLGLIQDMYRKGAEPEVAYTKDVENQKILSCLNDVWDIFQSRRYYGMRVKMKNKYFNSSGKQVDVFNLSYYLPQFEDEVLTGLWVRHHPESRSKVIVYGNAKRMLFDWEEKKRDVVIVEDPISAIKINCLGVPAYSLGGLDISTAEIVKLRMLYDRFVVWLDNDAASEKLITSVVRVLSLAGADKIVTIRSAPEPKLCHARRIIEELKAIGVDTDPRLVLH